VRIAIYISAISDVLITEGNQYAIKATFWIFICFVLYINHGAAGGSGGDLHTNTWRRSSNMFLALAALVVTLIYCVGGLSRKQDLNFNGYSSSVEATEGSYRERYFNGGMKNVLETLPFVFMFFSGIESVYVIDSSVRKVTYT
jgi:amino acid permease